jgi:hypothetical protein
LLVVRIVMIVVMCLVEFVLVQGREEEGREDNEVSIHDQRVTRVE